MARKADGGQEVIFYIRKHYNTLKMPMFCVVYGCSNRSNHEEFLIVCQKLLFIQKFPRGTPVKNKVGETSGEAAEVAFQWYFVC